MRETKIEINTFPRVEVEIRVESVVAVDGRAATGHRVIQVDATVFRRLSAASCFTYHSAVYLLRAPGRYIVGRGADGQRTT